MALIRPLSWLLLPTLAGMLVADVSANTAHPGEAPYRKICFICHDRGVRIYPSLGAPRLGDRIAWESRVHQSVDGLYGRIVGERSDGFQMPMGDLSEVEIKAAIAFMLDKSR